MSAVTLPIDPFDCPPHESVPAVQIPDGVYFMHPYLEVWKTQHDNRRNSRCTVAYRQVDAFRWEAGFAFCSPKDQFIKKVGRNLALQSLKHAPVTFRVPSGMDECDVICKLIDHMPYMVDGFNWMAQSWSSVLTTRYSW
jgi:hypothetical protein